MIFVILIKDSGKQIYILYVYRSFLCQTQDDI